MGILLNNSYGAKKWPPISSTSKEGESESTSDEQPVGRKTTASSEGIYYAKPNENSYEKWYKSMYPGSAKDYDFTYIADKNKPSVDLKHENDRGVITLNMPKGQFINHKSILTTVLRDKYNDRYNIGMGDSYTHKMNIYLKNHFHGQIKEVDNPLEAYNQYLSLTSQNTQNARFRKRELDRKFNESTNYANYFDNDRTKLAYKLYYNPETSKEAREGWSEFKKKLSNGSTYSYYDYFMKNYLPNKLASMEESGNYPDEYTKKTVYNMLGKRQ